MKINLDKMVNTKPTMLLRPGDFNGNAEVVLAEISKLASEGVTEIELSEEILFGGDCASLNEYPAFREAGKVATEKFLRDIAKLDNAPKVIVVEGSAAQYVGAGADARFPFCGHPDKVFRRQVEGLVTRLGLMNCRSVVIGISGGLDSALTLLVAHSAFKSLGYDSNGIHVYTMPGFGTTARTRGNADLLCEGLGLELETIDITAACRRHFKDIGHSEEVHDVVFENAQARERTQILMDKANQLGGIVLGTGDMSEIALGWCTYNGDHMSMFGTNSGVPKTAVRDVCLWWADAFGIEKSAKALRDIVATPVSPELLPAKDGEITQKTEDKIGPYELHDFFMWHFIELKEGRLQILNAAMQAFDGQYDEAAIGKWLDVFFKRIFSQAFKRNCAPDGIRIFPVYFSPEAWHVPSCIRANV